MHQPLGIAPATEQGYHPAKRGFVTEKGQPLSLTVKELAELVQGTLHGDGSVAIQAARSLGEAKPGDITFLVDQKNLGQLQRSRASAAIVPSSVPPNGIPLIQVKDPLAAFVVIFRHLRGEIEAKSVGVDSHAFVHPTAVVGEGASILPFASIGEGVTIGDRCLIHSGAVVGRHCKLGDDVTLYPNAVIYDDCILGNRVMVHANAVIGADGFGYRLHDGKYVKVPQLGRVEIGDDVEIGACTTIDRGTFEATRVAEGTKIDNLVQVAHNCQIGKHNLFISQMGIAGSSSTGDFVVIAGQAGITDHVHIGAGAIIGAKAGVMKDVPVGHRVLGAPARPERDEKRILITLEKLPEMRKELRRVLQHLGLAENVGQGDNEAKRKGDSEAA
jgi:UDP-3-O-[3-hydroxymyristoyl] glucosamine N-acyltransferase